MSPHRSDECPEADLSQLAPKQRLNGRYTEKYYSKVTRASSGRRPGRPAKPQAVVYDEFDDQWNCAMCRSAKAFCRLHTSLNNDGVRPPKSWEGLV